MEKDKKLPKESAGSAEPESASPSHIEEFFRSLQSETRSPRPDLEAVAAAIEAAEDATASMTSGSSEICRVCGHRNRAGNRFCAMCGVALVEAETAAGSGMEEEPLPKPAAGSNRGVVETHHYHHHYHHHYLPGYEGTATRPARDSARDSTREDKLRPNAALRGDMSRAEAAVRRITHEWVLASNTKHLDDLLDLYVADAVVLRSNYPPVRGAAAVREFFFGALDAGLGEVELEPLRVEVVGDLAYEAGRCKALVPGAVGKRREERGKYLWVCARQSNGEWKLAADCWSSDLTFTTMESDVPPSAGVKTREPRKG